MILPRPGLWTHAAGRWLVWDRLYNITTAKPSMWCRVRLRYLKTQEDAARDRATYEPQEV